MKDIIYQQLLDIKKRKGYFCLIDPDKVTISKAIEMGIICQDNGADALLIGGSLMLHDSFDDTIKNLKESVQIPVIIFPGIFNFVSEYADAILLLSMISSRNPQLLIGEQVRSAPLIKLYDLESIGTGYMLIESGSLTSVQYMGNCIPIPRTKKDIAIAHALAAQYLGMKMIYLETGSGAAQTVPEEMITAVKNNCELPIIVGGGIRTAEKAKSLVQAGADFIVTGTILEQHFDAKLIRSIANAVHFQ